MEEQVNSVAANMMDLNDSTTKLIDGTLSKGLAAGTKGFGNMKKISDEILKNFKEVWKIYQQMGIVSGTPGSGKLGMGTFSRGEKVAMGAMFAGAAMYDMMPNTAAAVTQRMAANTMVGLTGMGPNRLIKMSNRALGLGMTSVGSAIQTSMALTFQGGMLPNSYVRNNLMNQIGGVSAFSGMANQDVATALSQVNSMNFLRTGTMVRNSRGDLVSPNKMINRLYNSMYSGRDITKEQAALAANPYTAAYRTISQVSGGNEQLRQMLTAGIQFRAIAGRDLTKKDLRDPNKVFDIMGLPKDDLQRANLRKIFADTKVLEESQKGLVQGYTDSLNISSSLSEGFAKVAGELGPVYDGLARLKGILQTFPATGGIAGTVSGIGSTAAGMMLASRFLGPRGGLMMGSAMSGAGGGVRSAMLGNRLAMATSNQALRGAAFTSSVKGALGFGGKLGGKIAPGIGAALSGYYGFKDEKAGTGLLGGLGSAMFYGAAGGAITGAIAGGGVGALPGAVAGALISGGGYLAGRAVGNIGGDLDAMGGDNDRSTGGGKLQLQSPVPPGTRISSGYGPREKAAAEAAKKGKKISSFHRGLDYAVPIGTKVAAAGDGVVTESGNHRDYGLYVIISHGKKSTLYGHLSKINARRGQKVSAGDTIGLSGDTGQGVTGPHLHFEVRNNGGVAAQGRKNPENFLTRAFKAGKNVVAAGKNIITSGINMIKRTINRVFGTNLTYNDVSMDATKWDFTGSSSLGQQLSSQSISETIANAINSGSPIGYDSFRGATGRFKTRVNVDGKAALARGRVNGVENLVSGDSGTMAGGNRANLMKMLYRAGFRGKGLETAFAVALAESGGRSRAFNPKGRDLSYGLFQINMNNADPSSPNMGRNRLKQFGLQRNEDLYDPMTNIKAAYEISNGGKWWKQWGAYTNGSFVKYLDDARRAAKKAKIPIYHTGKDRVPEEQVALLDKDEMVLPPKLAEQVRNGTTPTSGTTNINVRMDVNIARAGAAEAEYMFQQFKSKIEHELNQKNMGVF